MLINGWGNVGTKKLKSPKAFTEYSEKVDNVYENLEDYNPAKKRRALIMSDDMTADMEFNKKNKSYCYWIVFKSKKTQYFICFYVTVLFQCA